MPPSYEYAYQTQVFANVPFEIFIRTQDPAYIAPFLSETWKYRAEALRAFDGAISFYREDVAILHLETGTVYLDKARAPILIDQLQGYVSRMARAGCLTGEPAYYDEALHQIRIFSSALRDPQTGLWAHGRGWSDSAQTIAATKWGRGHAWLLRGFVETLSYLPKDSAYAREVAANLENLAETLLKYQDSEGF
jgi:hypothetical protein